MFGGPADEGIPWLELASREAEACGDAETQRWAMHDLGISLWWQGRLDESTSLLERSLDRAISVGDHQLVHRSVVNLLDACLQRGDPPDAAVAVAVAELDRLRRADTVDSATKLAGNLGDCMAEMGRLDDAIAYADEAVMTASSLTPTALRDALIVRSFVHRLRGDTAAATDDDAEADGLAADLEPQMRGWHLLWCAWKSWWDDPQATLQRLLAGLGRSDAPAPVRNDVAHEAARMAFRVGDVGRLEKAVALMHGCGNDGGPGLRAQRRWDDVLLDRGPQGRLEDAAARLEGLGWRRRALDAWADAALLAARAERPSGAGEHALTLARSTGLHPLLGPLPETRWLAV